MSKDPNKVTLLVEVTPEVHKHLKQLALDLDMPRQVMYSEIMTYALIHSADKELRREVGYGYGKQ